MTTSKQSSGLLAFFPATCNTYTDTQINYSLTKPSGGRQGKIESGDAAVGAAVVIFSDVFHFVWQTSLHSASASIPHINITDCLMI